MEDSEVDADYSSVLDAPPADAGAYSIATGVLGDGPEQYTLNTAPAGAPHTGQIAAVLMQQALAAASVVASLVLVLLSIALGWFCLWHTTLKDIGFFRDVLGLNRAKAERSRALKAANEAEIARIKRQHSRGLRTQAA